jgi:hypothetical protein
MTLNELSNIRLCNQKVVGTEFKTAKEVVGWTGAMQAQDYPMAKLAVGARMLNATDEKIESAFNNGEIIRTHIMRPTWHFVSSEDIYWMLELTAQKIKSSLKSRHKELGLTQALLTQSNSIIEKALQKGIFLTREELASEFHKVKINVAENRLSHLLLCAELDGITCSGPLKGKKQTYALLQDRVPYTKRLTRDESLTELAKRYFTSHGPATLQDFTWWSGLSATEAKLGLESVKPLLISETIDSEKYWLAQSSLKHASHNTSVYLLPAFDEFLISYKDRSASLSLTDNKKAVSDNGIFRPVIVANGQVSGLWKRTVMKDSVRVETSFFHPQPKMAKELIEKAVMAWVSFWEMPIKMDSFDD